MSATRLGSISASTKEFPPFRLDTINECLWHHRDDGDDERIRLTPKAFAVLRYLVDHAGRLVTQNEILESAWPDTFVQPEVLKSQILDIRRALGDDPKNPRFIETLPKRGYRFILPVKEAPAKVEFVGEAPLQKFVGRDKQLNELNNRLEKSFSNQRQIVFITGETGIGKTTLADEFLRRASTDFSGIHIARGQCIEGYGSQEPYYAMLEALSQLCGGSSGESVVKILSAQAPTWLVQFPALVTREQRDMLQREIVGATRERMLREIGEALETISSEKPLLLVLEDLHWADPSTVDLISVLARRRGLGKLMLICTYRPVDVTLAQHPLKAVKQDLLVHQLCREIALEPLTETEVSEYLALESPGADVPEGLAALVHQHSEGNPLFMAAVLEQMQNQGLISIENGAWHIKAPLESIHLEAPESLRQMIELQIERLSADEQLALEVASITGVSFTAKANANALNTNVSQEKFEDLCEGLARRQYMVCRVQSHRSPDGTISKCYKFAHALYRDVFYRRQAPGRVARLRQSMGETAAEAFPVSASNEIAADVASHSYPPVRLSHNVRTNKHQKPPRRSERCREISRRS